MNLVLRQRVLDLVRENARRQARDELLDLGLVRALEHVVVDQQVVPKEGELEAHVLEETSDQGCKLRERVGFGSAFDGRIGRGERERERERKGTYVDDVSRLVLLKDGIDSGGVPEDAADGGVSSRLYALGRSPIARLLVRDVLNIHALQSHCDQSPPPPFVV